jgi:hypothetical protein
MILMDSCLGFVIPGTGDPTREAGDPIYYFDGQALLERLNRISARVTATRPEVKGGSKDNLAVSLSSFEQWLGGAAYLRNNYSTIKPYDMYYSVAGRTIQKIGQRSGAPAPHKLTSDGFYMRDFWLLQKQTGADKDSPLGQLGSKVSGPSYRDLASYYWRVTSQVSGSTASYELLTSTAALIIREILAGTSRSYRSERGATKVFPLLTAVMFLAEPARNIRTFPLGLMVLDLLGQPYHFSYGGKGAFTAAKRGGVDVGSVPRNPKASIRGRLTLDVALAHEERVAGKGKQFEIEGEYSASPKGSALMGQISIQRANIDRPTILAKEVNILVNWLSVQLDKERVKGAIGAIPFALPVTEKQKGTDVSTVVTLPSIKWARIVSHVSTSIDRLITRRLASPAAM